MILNARQAIFLSYAAALTLLSMLPGSVSLDVNIWDKFQHCLAYFIFMLLACQPLPATHSTAKVGIVALMYSGAIELAQTLSPDRIPSAADFFANAVGIALAATARQLIAQRHFSVSVD